MNIQSQLPDDLEYSCRRVHWFMEPEDVFECPGLYLQHVMGHGNEKDVAVAKKYFTDEEFIDALESSPPGKINSVRWDYWRGRLGLSAAPSPQRFADINLPDEWWRGAI